MDGAEALMRRRASVALSLVFIPRMACSICTTAGSKVSSPTGTRGWNLRDWKSHSTTMTKAESSCSLEDATQQG